jgi:hypothetical protein
MTRDLIQGLFSREDGDVDPRSLAEFLIFVLFDQVLALGEVIKSLFSLLSEG